MNVHLGLMTTIAILCALIADFLFLPTLLIRFSNPSPLREVELKN